jgi:hypothetical protein
VFALGKNSKTLVQIFYMPFFYVSRVTNLTTPRSAPAKAQSCQIFNQNLVLLSVFSFSSFGKAKFAAFVRIFIWFL